jgi:hypothetical protein
MAGSGSKKIYGLMVMETLNATVPPAAVNCSQGR